MQPTKPDKYRIYLKTRRGNYTLATGTSVNGLLKQIGDWLDGPGANIKDSELSSVQLQQLDKQGGLISQEQSPVEKRNQIAEVAEQLGAR